MSITGNAQNVNINSGNLILTDSSKKIRTPKIEFPDGSYLTSATGLGGSGGSVPTLEQVIGSGNTTSNTVYFSNASNALVINNGSLHYITDIVINSSESNVRIGREAGSCNQGSYGVALGFCAGIISQSERGIAIGTEAGAMSQGVRSIAMGQEAGEVSSGSDAISIGYMAGNNTQGCQAVSIGTNAGSSYQGALSISIGQNAGIDNQASRSIAIGEGAGKTSQSSESVAIGRLAGESNQSCQSVAIGRLAGRYTQGVGSVCIGQNAGTSIQGNTAVAIGFGAGQSHQGVDAIAIGNRAGQTSQHNNTIVLNASGSALNTDGTSRTFIKPVRSSTANRTVYWNSSTNELVASTTKSFMIDHPTDSERYLVHACLEGPEQGVYYRGTVTFDGTSQAIIINLPEYVRNLLIVNPTPTIITTPVWNGAFVQTATSLYDYENNRFIIYCNGICHVNWYFVSKRDELDVEPLKSSFE